MWEIQKRSNSTTCGVPQGSVIGPLMLIGFIDVLHLLMGFTCFQFGVEEHPQLNLFTQQRRKHHVFC